jgi:hypothetical protein
LPGSGALGIDCVQLRSPSPKKRVDDVFEVSRKNQEVAGARLDSAIGFAAAFEKCHFLKVDRCQQVEAAWRFRASLD